MTLKKIWLNGPPNHFLIPEFDFFFEELWDAVGFDFFSEVFKAGDVSERRRPTNVVTKSTNADYQDKGENHFILVLCLYIC